MEEKSRFRVISLYMAALLILGAFWPSTEGLFDAYYRILTSPGVLVSDFFQIGSIAASLINAGLVGLIAIAIIYLTGTTMSGPTIAAVFTLAGFAFFGKTPINIWPIMVGVAISSRLINERFRTYIVVALFGTALGPAVSAVAFGLELGYLTGVVAGIILGMVLPALASHVLHNHQGFSLYNVGFTCGIVGMFLLSQLKTRGLEVHTTMIWNEHSQTGLGIAFSVYFLSMIILGWSGRKKVKEIWKLPGTLVTDFVTEQGFASSLFNMGLVGLMGMGYIAAVKGHFNGPTLGGVFTMVGFAAFGKHVKNVWPLMLGVYLATLLSVWQPNDPGPLLAALFGTTLAPVAGGFGPMIGIITGMLHLSVVMHVGVFHAGMNLYNNGFAGGLVGTLVIALSRWLNLGPRR